MTPSEAAQAQRAMLEPLLSESPRDLIFWYYTPMAMSFTSEMPRDLTIYDNMDELSAFRGAPPELLAEEAKLLKRADLVFTGGLSLYEAKRDRNPNVFSCPSSIDFAHFSKARRLRAERIRDWGPSSTLRVGFFAVIDERLDAELLRLSAILKPEWRFEMIGPVVKIDPAELPSLPNIAWLGPRSYEELPACLAEWDVGMMPFAVNEATKYISPTKTPEFLAAGLPLVSTPIRDVVRTYGDRGLVSIASDALSFVAAIEKLSAKPDPQWLEKVDAFLARSSWDGTWASMQEKITARLDPARLDPPISPGCGQPMRSPPNWTGAVADLASVEGPRRG
jgi:glycosyltransferase involved in cell wall biosynthesis